MLDPPKPVTSWNVLSAKRQNHIAPDVAEEQTEKRSKMNPAHRSFDEPSELLARAAQDGSFGTG